MTDHAVRAIRPAHFPWFDYARYTFSLGLEWDGNAWLSGHSASEYDAEEGRIVVRGGMADQTRTAYAKIAAILDAAGFSTRDVRRVVEYVTEPGLDVHAGAVSVRDEVFAAESRPVFSTIAVRRLLRPQALIEIEVTAARGEGDVSYVPSIAAPSVPEAVQRLAGAGEDAHLVKVVAHVAGPTEALRVKAEIAEVLAPSSPAITVAVVPRLLDRATTISLDAVTSRAEPEVITDSLGRVAAVRAGRFVFCSGPGAATAVVGEGVAAQAAAAYAKLSDVLAAAGATSTNLVKTVEYVTEPGLDRYRDVAGVRDRLFTEPFPASTGLVCDELPAPGQLFEVDATALL